MADRVRTNVRSTHICRHMLREHRRNGANFRQMLRDARTNDEQLELLTNRPGQSAREKVRLTHE